MDFELTKVYTNTLLSTEGAEASKEISGHQKYSRPLNCLSMNVLHWLPSNRLITTLGHKQHSWTLLQCILVIISLVTHGQSMAAQVTSISPFIVPLQGGTIIYVTGTGFTSVSYPKCQLQTDNGVLAVEDNTVVNDTRMQCVLPTIPLLYQQSIIQNNNITQFKIIDGVNGSVALTFFDLDHIRVSSITPNWTYISQDNIATVTILGIGFVETYEITCHSSLFEVKATFVNATQLMCLFPTIDMTTKINIDVYSIGQSSSVVQKQTTDQITFTYFATPPEVLFFKFNPSYTSLLLEFDREVELGNETQFNNTIVLSCEIIFTSLEIFGTPFPSCHWQNTQQRQIIIQLNTNSSVQPNMSVSLHYVIRTRYVAYSKLTTGTITVMENEKPLHLVPVIEGPQIIPYCGSFTLNGQKSYNSGFRPLQYIWKVEIIDIVIDSSGSGDNDSSIHTLEENTNLISNESTIILSADIFYENIEYIFSLTVTNFLGESNKNALLMMKANQPALNTWIIGNSYRVANPHVPFYVEAKTNVPNCLTSNLEVKYKWILSKHDSIINLNNVITTNKYIRIESFTFEYNSSYILSFHASVNAVTSMANVSIDSIPFFIKASIFGGSHVEYGKDDDILLVETGSIEYYNKPLLVAQWTCLTESEQMPCLNSSSNLELVLPTGFEVIIHPNTLLPSVYLITVHLLYANELVSYDQQVLHIRNDTNGPKVFIELPLNYGRINIHEYVLINGIVQSALPGEVTWTSVFKSGYAYLALDNNTIITPLVLPITTDTQLTQTTEGYPMLFTSNITQPPFSNPVSLYIPSESLLPDNQYIFRLTVSSTADIVRYSEIEIQTATHPSSGDFLFVPSSGVAMQTIFHITAVHWTDNSDDFPLYYRLGIKMVTNDSTTWLTSRTEENRFITILPGGFGNGTLTIVLEVSDAFKATSTVSKDIVVVQSDTVDLIYIHDLIKKKASNKSSVNEALSYLVATLFSIDSDNYGVNFHGITKQEFKLSMIELIIELYYKSAFQPSNVWLHEILITVLKSITTNISLSNVNTISVLEIIEEVVQHEELLQVLPNGGEDVITVYSNLLISSSQNEKDNSRIFTDVVTESFNNMYKEIGYSVCKRMGLFTSSQYIINSVIGSIKLYNGLFLSTINLTCDTSGNNGCPFTEGEQSFANISKNLQEVFASFTCSEGVNINKCSSYCTIALQLLNDIHWMGSPYASIIKSYPISLHLISTDNDMEILDDVLVEQIDYIIPLKFERSIEGTLKCVYWNKESIEWDDKDCIIAEETLMMDGSIIIHCSCKHLSTQVAIIDLCQPGYYGINCDKECPYGLYGDECIQVCECSDMGVCSPYNGSCDCSPGWTGTICDTVCSNGQWGKDCSKNCQCQNNGLCNSINGECDCPPGWTGDYCDTECPSGFYGNNCTSVCLCRLDIECDFITGDCSCNDGYTGVTCHSPCEDGYYGNNCSGLCTCDTNGTDRCDNVNGTCLCLDMWSGNDCEIQATPPYSPTPVVAPSSFPVWIAATPASLCLLLALIVFIVFLLVWITYRKHRQKSVVFPLVQQEKGRLDHSQSESKDASVLLDENGDELELTRAMSCNVVIPEGKILSDLFSSGSPADEFREPEQIGIKRRWQIIQLLSSTGPSITHSPAVATEELKAKHFKEGLTEKTDRMKVESGIEVESMDGYESDSSIIQRNETPQSIQSDGFQEIVYRKGIYLDKNATLKELRNAFIDSCQLKEGNMFFQFLNSDLPGDTIPIDNEEEIFLSKLEPNLLIPKTMYIEPVSSSNVAIELCVCGKFAELECMECRVKGYCSDMCQQAHWLKHISTCRIVSARRRHAKKMKKKRKKLDKMKRTGYTPHPEQCMCGGDAVYECSECGRQGYCSQRCQEDDWELHQLFCTNNGDVIIEEHNDTTL